MGCGLSTRGDGAQDASNAPGLPPDQHAATANTTNNLDGVPPDNPNSTSQRPNRLIQPPPPLAKSPKRVSHLRPPWTRSHLNTQRNYFWETRVQGVGGSPAIWDALRSVCESLLQGDLRQAQAILDAANINCPSGRVARTVRGRQDRDRGGVYDESGRLYDLPDWVMTDPMDLVEDPEKESASDGADDDDDEALSSRPQSRAQHDKGKGRAMSIGEQVQITARLSDRVGDVVVSIGEKQPTRVAIQKIQERVGDGKVWLVYMGRVLDENKTLESQGWTVGHLVNAYVFGDASTESNKAQD